MKKHTIILKLLYGYEYILLFAIFFQCRGNVDILFRYLFAEEDPSKGATEKEMVISSPVVLSQKRKNEHRVWNVIRVFPIENFTNVPDSTPLRLHSLKPRCKISFWQELATSLSIRKCNLAQIQQRPALSPLVVSSLTPRLPMSYILPFCTFRSPTPPYPWKLPRSDRIYVCLFHFTYSSSLNEPRSSNFRLQRGLGWILYICVCVSVFRIVRHRISPWYTNTIELCFCTSMSRDKYVYNLFV